MNGGPTAAQLLPDVGPGSVGFDVPGTVSLRTMLPDGRSRWTGVVRRIAEASHLPPAGAAADTRCCDVVSCGLSLQYDMCWELRLRENRAEFFSARARRDALGNL
jgi:hypothetical protein